MDKVTRLVFEVENVFDILALDGDFGVLLFNLLFFPNQNNIDFSPSSNLHLCYLEREPSFCLKYPYRTLNTRIFQNLFQITNM